MSERDQSPAASVASEAVVNGHEHAHGHLVEFYESDAFLVETVRDFFLPALRDGHGAVIVATAEHRGAFRLALQDAGVDVEAAEADDRLIMLDARDTLALFMGDAGPDAVRFTTAVGAVLRRAGANGERAVRAYGEMVALLWADREITSAIALEGLWNDLGEVMPFSLLCAYPMNAFDDAQSAAAFSTVCDLHSHVIPAEGYSRLPSDDPDEQRRVVASLQQELAALRADLTRARSEQALLEEYAYVDFLTGVANRRVFENALAREWALARRDELDSHIVVLDLDGFKALNDEAGHAAGDHALRRFAHALRLTARSTDIVARLGGDEFAVLLTRCDAGAANMFIARLRSTAGSRVGAPIAFSAGTASLARSVSPADALERADRQMYARKPQRRGTPDR
jgi:diguanylate cyclase (GGDEF)-like protein